MSDDQQSEQSIPRDNDSVEQSLLRGTASLIQSKDAALDSATLSRLHKARYAALEKHRTHHWRWMSVGGAVTAAALLTVVLQVTQDVPSLSHQESLTQLVESEPENIDDLEMLASAADLELLEDLEFYLWLEKHDRAGESRQGKEA